jgi:hypothetical protein
MRTLSPEDPLETPSLDLTQVSRGERRFIVV